MQCNSCDSQLLGYPELFFFCKTQKDVNLSIKPEILELVLKRGTIYIENTPDHKEVKCKQCNVHIGSVCPFGPNGKDFCAFGCSRIKLGGKAFPKQKWWQLYQNKEYSMIDNRDMSTFLNVFNVKEAKIVKQHHAVQAGINYPSTDELNHFEWYTVSHDKIPRYYQIEAYVEALQRNLVAVIKTGAGKTLIASMFLAKMCSLNPKKMGLFIVDRVPLTFQQGEALRKDTSLRVISITGENKTSHKIKQLNNNCYDILVITAGAFYDMVTVKKKLDVNLFCAVVLDECHHVSRGHRYVDVLKLFTSVQANIQPRILGLTASPVNAKNFESAIIGLKAFLKAFPSDTKIYYPTLEEASFKINEERIERTDVQKDFIKKCIERFDKIREEISKEIGVKDITTVKSDLLKCNQAVGELRSISEEYGMRDPELNSKIKDAIRLLDAVEMCNLLGVQYGCKHLITEKKDDSNEFTKLAAQFENTEKESPRLLKLQDTISTLKPESKILVFVSRRDIARMLAIHLQKEFEELNVNKVVGHGGYDGMEWEGGQKEIIKRFSTGSCNLLVCTSVLEEGIDVASCDLVVYFTGVQSLIKFIQARGRARKAGSRFIVYHGENEISRKRNLQSEEKILQRALKHLQIVENDVDQKTKAIIGQIEENMDEQDESKLSTLKSRIFDKSDSDLSFMVYVDQIEGIKVTDIKDKLMDLLEESQEFELNRLDRIKSEADIHSIAKNSFSKNTLRFLVGVKCVDCSKPKERYRRFCEISPYHLELQGKNILMWSKLMKIKEDIVAVDEVDTEEENLSSRSTIEASGFQMGYLRNKTNYVVGHTVEYDSTISMKGSDIVVRYNNEREENRDEQIIIPKSSIGNFVLLSSKKEAFTVAFNLSYCPTMEKIINDENFERLTVQERNEIGLALSKYPLLLINFQKQHFNDVLQALEITMPIPCFDTKLQEVEKEQHEREAFNCIEDMEEVLWSLKCFKDSRTMIYLPEAPFLVHQKFIEQPEKKELIKKIVQRCCLRSSNSYFSGFENMLSHEYQTFENTPIEDVPEEIVPDEHFVIKRAVVTPLRIIALPAVPVASNRMLRMLVGRFQIMVVSFKDEDGSKLRTTDTLHRVKECIMNGISINGKKYNFFAATSSQLRDHKAYFLETTMQQIYDLRKEIIPFPEKFKCHAKYFSRLGIYGTADKCVGEILDDNINRVGDQFAENGDNVTDGAGKISHSKAKEISKELVLDKVPSAFQIRFSGIKGILVTTPDNDQELNGKEIAVRPSMEKFQNNDRKLCVTSTSKINEFTLNREIITLLDAIPHMHDNKGLKRTLMEYQEKVLAKYSGMFSDVKEAHEELRTYIEPDYINALSSSSMELLDEPYWISILQGIYRLRTAEIRTKTSIPVEKSCLIVGVPDPVGVLKEGEVFVQLQAEEEENTKVLEDSLLIFRNPCLHPGDIRTVTGVYREELKHLYNVVVFPTKDCKESLAVSCSGGDLDGDQYAVIWDKDMIPPKECMYPPCDYSALATQPKPIEEEISIQKQNITDQVVLAEFFTMFMSNDCLGRVAHKHLALCDIQPKGARDAVACELAKSQAQAVDFPKTGIVPEVPKEALELVKSFPDFMEKPLSETHISKKVLGDMYRRSCSLMFDFGGVDGEDEGCLFGKTNLQMNHNLIVERNDQYLREAGNIYMRYAKEMDMLLKKFELKVEADIVLGQATMDWSNHLEADKGKAGKAIKSCYEQMVKKYRNIFFSDVIDDDSKQRKASAWYRVVNDSNLDLEMLNINDNVYKSFPWVVSDVLCTIRWRNNDDQISRMAMHIGDSALKHFKKNSKQLINNITDKTNKLKDVERALEKLCKEELNLSDGFIVSAYGSTSIYVSEHDSDIDICILPKPKVYESKIFPDELRDLFSELEPEIVQKHILSLVISTAIDKISSTKREILDAKVPIIKCSFADGDQNLECDISMNEVGFRKTLYIHHLYQSNPLYLPLFWILVRWARIAGIVKSELNKDKLIDTAEFYALIIHVLELPEMKEMNLEKPSVKTSIDHLIGKCDHFDLNQYYELGNKIFDFFRKASNLNGNVEIKWPAPGIDQVVVIDDSVMKTISTIAGKAFHALSATRDINALLNYFLLTCNDKTELNKLLPLSMSYSIGKARAFHSARLSAVTGALVEIDIKEGKRNLVLKAKGNRLAIENVQNEIRSLMDSNKALVLGRLPHKCSRYFMEGSSIIIARNNNDPSTNLHHHDSFSSFELHHDTCQRSATYFIPEHEDETDNDSWKEKEITRFYKHTFNQLQKFPTADNEEILESLQVTSRFGTFYLVDIDCSLPDSQNTIQIQELQLAVEKGRRSRKSWQQREFRPSYDSFGIDDLPSEPQLPEKKFEMVPLPSSKGNKDKFREKLENDFYKVKRTRSGIAAAFSPGLLKDNTKDLTAKRVLLEAYRNALKDLDFKEGQSTKREVSPTWKASVNPSASYEVQVNLDKDLNVLKVSERPLNWVHGTILDGSQQHFNRNLRTNSDIRVLLSTQDVVKEGTDLYQSVVPGGIAPFRLNGDKPVVDKNQSTQNGEKNFVSLIRNVKETEVYTNGALDACILSGQVYFGDDLTITKPFCELSLLFDSKAVTESISSNFGDNGLKKFVEYVFEISLKIKERLDQTLQQSAMKMVE